jgi:hypothetical protein
MDGDLGELGILFLQTCHNLQESGLTVAGSSYESGFVRI